MLLPGFTAERSLEHSEHAYRTASVFGCFPSAGQTIPQLQIGPGGSVDMGSYLRCIANGGGDLVCRFFAGLPPFTIGGLQIR